MHLKQRFLLIVSFLFAFALFPNAAYAESQNSLSGVAETIEELFGFIPNIITLEKLLGEDAAAMFWARFLLWVLLFAAFYYGGSFAFKVEGKVNTRIAGTVAFVFATISALLIPDKIIIGIFQSYGLLSAIIIWFVPVIAGFFLVSMIKPRPAKAVIYLGMIFVLVAIDNSITSKFAADLANNLWFPFFKLLLAVVIIAFLWNLLFAGIEGWNAGVHGGHGGGWGGGNQPWHNPSNPNHPGPGPAPPGPHPPGPGPHPLPGPQPGVLRVRHEALTALLRINRALVRLAAGNNQQTNMGHFNPVQQHTLWIHTALPHLNLIFPRKQINFAHLTDEQKIKLGINNTQKGRDLLHLLGNNVNFWDWFNVHEQRLQNTVNNHLGQALQNYHTRHGHWPQVEAHINNAKTHVYQMTLALETLLRINHPNIGTLHP